MVEITVNKDFYDAVEKVDRKPGDTFEATEERAAYIDAVLPGYVTLGAKKAEKEADDLSKLTVAQLTKLAGERGVEVPKGAKKAELLEILEG